MGCDFYIYTYLYVYFQDMTSYIPIFIKCKRGYFNDDDDNDDDLIPNKPILIYSATNNFVNRNYNEKYKEIIQEKLDYCHQKWENVIKIKKIEKRVERF